MRADLAMWRIILQRWNGTSFLTQEPSLETSEVLATDASGSKGFGGFYFKTKQWFQSHWSKDIKLPDEKALSIAFQEIYPIVVASLLFGERWQRRKVLFLCDNSAAVYIINKGYSKCSKIMQLIRRLVLTATVKGFDYEAQHLSGVHNESADALSRFQMDRFRHLQPDSKDLPVPCPPPHQVLLR